MIAHELFGGARATRAPEDDDDMREISSTRIRNDDGKTAENKKNKKECKAEGGMRQSAQLGATRCK